MVGQRTPDDELQRAVDAVERHRASGERFFLHAAAKEMGLPPNTLKSRVRVAVERGLQAGAANPPPTAPIMPSFPDDDLPADQILDMMARRFEQRRKADEAKKWFEIGLRSNEPIGIIWFGDPHLGNNGCNVPLLRRDVRLAAGTAGLYAANIGDTADNWGMGKLLALYASNDVSRATERRLARWLLQEAGVRWLLWLEGNHDRMDGAFITYLRAINASVVPMIDWRAKFQLRFPNGRVVRIDAAHNHKGASIWNELHGQTRAAMIDEPADLFLAGHHHTWGLAVKELPGGRVSTLARARGYKWIDDHAVHGGFTQQQCGASILTVIDPSPRSPTELVRAFADAEEGVDYLTWKRRKAA